MKIINIMVTKETYAKLESLSEPDCLSFDKTVTQAINELWTCIEKTKKKKGTN